MITKELLNIAMDYIINIVNLTAEQNVSADKTRKAVYDAVEFARNKLLNMEE